MRGQPCPRGGLGPSGEGSHPAGCTRAWPRGLRGRRGWHQADPSGASRVPSSPPPAGPWTAHSGCVTLDVRASVCPVALRVRLRCPRRGGSRASAPARGPRPGCVGLPAPWGPRLSPPGGGRPPWEPLHEATASQRPRQLTGSRHERERSRRCSRRAAPRGAAPCHADGATEGTRPLALAPAGRGGPYLRHAPHRHVHSEQAGPRGGRRHLAQREPPSLRGFKKQTGIFNGDVNTP